MNSGGMESIKKTVDEFKLHEPLAQLTFLQTRVAVGGITECELVAYRKISNTIIETVNQGNSDSSSIGDKAKSIKSFHIKAGKKTNDFKNKHIAVLMESITADYYKDFFGAEKALAVIEQDEGFLANILAERLPTNFGCSVIIALTGDIDADVAKLDELAELLLKRNVRELVSTQVETLKVKQCNPWQTIQQKDVPAQTNHLIVNYIDNSQESILDIDLIQQILYISGMFKKIQNKEHQARAVLKKAENKRRYDEIHKDLPKEQDVYDVMPENILGTKKKQLDLDKPVIKDIVPDKKSRTLASDSPNSIDETANYSGSNKTVASNKSLLGKLINPFSIKLPVSKEKKEKKLKFDMLVKRIALLKQSYLTGGVLDDKQPNTGDIVYADYTKELGNAFQEIKVIESILDATLNNKDEIDPNHLNYSFIDVTAGVFAKVNWQSDKYVSI